MSCPNCFCPACMAARGVSVHPPLPDPGPPCAYDQIAKDYAARGEPLPAALYLYCPCRRCNPICM